MEKGCFNYLSPWIYNENATDKEGKIATQRGTTGKIELKRH